MNGAWRELLARLVDGDELSPAEAAALREALDDQANRRDAAEWLDLEAALRERFHPAGAGQVHTSRERLLAKAILREKHLTLLAPPTGPRRAWSGLHTGLAAVGLVLAAGIAALLLAPGGGPPDGPAPADAWPRAEGDFRIARADGAAPDDEALRRGDGLISGSGEARVALGDHCRLTLDPRTEITLLGEPHSDVVDLRRGRVVCRLEPGRGRLKVLTPLGFVEVKGTEFITKVEYPQHQKEEFSMKALKRSVVVTVIVLSGAVAYDLADSAGVLQTGASRVFAGEKAGTEGVVVRTTDLSVTLKVGDKEETFHTGEKNKLAVREIGQLNPGEKVTVTWVEEEGKKWVKDIDGKGTIEGEVVAKSEHWIEVKPKEGRAQRLGPPWRGGNPSEGGGLDKEVLKKIAAVKVGDKVALTWEMPEGRRVVDIRPVK